MHRGSIVASHLSIPRDLRKASVVEGVMEEEREGMAPMMTVLKEMVNYQVSRSLLYRPLLKKLDPIETENRVCDLLRLTYFRWPYFREENKIKDYFL